MLAQEEGLRRLRAERFQAEVNARLREARNQINRDPEEVERFAQVVAQRDPPRAGVGAWSEDAVGRESSFGYRICGRTAAIVREQQERAMAVATQAAATERILTERERSASSVQQLVERFNALMSQQLYAEANTEIAPRVNELLPRYGHFESVGTRVRDGLELRPHAAIDLHQATRVYRRHALGRKDFHSLR